MRSSCIRHKDVKKRQVSVPYFHRFRSIQSIKMALTVSHGTEDEKMPAKKKVVVDFMTIKAFLTGIVSQVHGRVSMDTLRPLPMFIGITEGSVWFTPGAFTKPVQKFDKYTLEKFKSRIRLNFAFFISNYALVASMVALVVALLHPGMIAWLLILWGLWSFHTFLISNEVILAGRNVGSLISINHRSNALTVLSVVVICLKCFRPAITVVVLSTLLILSHAVARDPNNVETSGSFQFKKTGSDDESDGETDDLLLEHDAA